MTRFENPLKTTQLREPWFLKSNLRLFTTLFLVLLLPTVLFITVTFIQTQRTLKTQAIHQNTLVTQLAAKATEEHFNSTTNYIESFAKREKLIEALRGKDTAMLSSLLEDLVSENPNIDRALITDREGVLVMDYPQDSKLVGTNISHLAWWAGVKESNQSYVSDVFRRTTTPYRSMVAIATPVRDSNGQTMGYLSGNLTVENLLAWFTQALPMSPGAMTMIDRQGHWIVAYREQKDPLLDLSRNPLVRSMINGSEGFLEGADPLTQKESLFYYVKLKDSQWVVFSRLSLSQVYSSVAKLRLPFLILTLSFFLGVFFLHFIWLSAIRHYHATRSEGERALGYLASILFEYSDDAIVGKDLEGRVISWSRGAERIYGYSASEAQGKSITFLSPVERKVEIFQMLQRLKNGERVQDVETVRVRKDGKEIDISLTISPIKDASGKVIGGLSIGREITGSKINEKYLALQYAVALILAEFTDAREATTRIMSTIGQTMQWDLSELWMVDKDAQVLKRERSWHSASFGLTEFESSREFTQVRIGQGSVGRIWQRSQPEWISNLAADGYLLENPLSERGGLSEAFGFPIRKKGEVIGVMLFFAHKIRHVDEKSMRIFDSIGNQIGQFLERKELELQRHEQTTELAQINQELARRQRIMKSLLEDLQGSKKILEEQKRSLLEANKRLESLSVMKDEFIAAVSHELRTPLTAIKEGVSLVLDKILGPINEEQIDFLSTVDQNIDRLADLINNLLDLSKVEVGRIRLLKKKVEVKHLILDTIQHYKSVSGKRIIATNLKPCPLVLADLSRVLQVLGNLFSNAVKFTSNEGRILFSMEEKDGYVHVSLEDNGVGIAENDLPKLFQKFSQVGQKFAKGTGLGLALSKELIQLQGGQISVESQLGKGSKFSFTLPVYSSDLALHQYFHDQLDALKNAESPMVGMIVLDGQSVSVCRAQSKLAHPEQCYEEVVEFIQKRVHPDDSVLLVEPHWIVILTPTNAQALQIIINRISTALNEWAGVMKVDSSPDLHLDFGTAVYPTDGTQVEQLFQKSVGTLQQNKPVVSPQKEGIPYGR